MIGGEHRDTQSIKIEINPHRESSPNVQSYPKPLLVFVNPKSGRGKSVKIFNKQVTQYFSAHKLDYEVFITKADYRVRDFLATKTKEQLLAYQALVVVSGDGLVYELVNAIMSRPDWQEVLTLPIGIIPTGSGNGLAHTLIARSQTRVKNQKEVVELCCRQIAQIETCLSDLVRITYNGGNKKVWSFLSIGWGLLADIDVDSDWLRCLGDFRFTAYGLLRSLTSVSRRGRLSYKQASQASFQRDLSGESNSDASMYERKNDDLSSSAYSTDQKDLSIQRSDMTNIDANRDEDGWIHIEDKFACVYAVHQSHISHKTRFAPKSTPSDGLIYLTYVRGSMNPCRTIEFLTSIDDASHERLPYVKVVPVDTFKLEPLEPVKIVIDGEKIDWTTSQGPLTVEVLPKAMKLIWSDDNS